MAFGSRMLGGIGGVEAPRIFGIFCRLGPASLLNAFRHDLRLIRSSTNKDGEVETGNRRITTT